MHSLSNQSKFQMLHPLKILQFSMNTVGPYGPSRGERVKKKKLVINNSFKRFSPFCLILLSSLRLTMGSSDFVVVIPKLLMKYQSNEIIYLPVTKPRRALSTYAYRGGESVQEIFRLPINITSESLQPKISAHFILRNL